MHEIFRFRDENPRQLNGFKCPLTGCAKMEFSSGGECCNSNATEKTLVHMYGGVAYDHDSLPKVVAVHTWTPERLNINESSSFGLEQLSQRDPRHRNTVVTKPLTARFKSPPSCNRMIKEHNSHPAMDVSPSHEKNFQEKEPTSISQIRALLLTEHDHNKKEDIQKSPKAVTEVLPVAQKLPPPHGLKSIDSREVINSRGGNLENLQWSNIGVLSEKSPDNSYQHVQIEMGKIKSTERFSHHSKQNSTSPDKENSYQHVQIEMGKIKAIDGSYYHSLQNPGIKILKEPTSGKLLEKLDVVEEKMHQEASNGVGKTIGKPSLEICQKGGDEHEQKADYIIPRKRPRKSIPRKINIKRENLYSCLHSTDSEETQTADEITSDLSNHECTPVLSPSSSGSGSKSPCDTKVIFKRTAGVWSVSSQKSTVKENSEDTDTCSSNRESDADGDKHSKKDFPFTDLNTAPLPLCDSSSEDDKCLSSALDRQARIKELLRKQKELLAEVRQSKVTSQNSSL